MSNDDIEYGKLNKRIVFTENDHRHVKLLMRLKADGLTQSKFFRCLITGYIDGDTRIHEYIDEVGGLSIKRRNKSKKLREEGMKKLSDFSLNDGEIENIFDIIAEEHPEL
jgi:hypothetical protein|tara:strand:+ start:8605 stop:8934 length:330 start_codon:yes stop_codon:yes gene_type:complete